MDDKKDNKDYNEKEILVEQIFDFLNYGEDFPSVCRTFVGPKRFGKTQEIMKYLVGILRSLKEKDKNRIHNLFLLENNIRKIIKLYNQEIIEFLKAFIEEENFYYFKSAEFVQETKKLISKINYNPKIPLYFIFIRYDEIYKNILEILNFFIDEKDKNKLDINIKLYSLMLTFFYFYYIIEKLGFYVKVNPIKKQQLFNKAKEIYEDVLFSFSVLLNNIKGKSPQKIEKCISRSKVNIRDFLSWSKRSESDIYYFLEPETFVLRLENQITELIEIINKIVKKLNIVVFVILTDVDHIITTKNTLTIEISKQYIINIVLKQIHVNNVIFIHEYTYSLKNSLPNLYIKIVNDSLNKVVEHKINYSWVLYKIFNLIFFTLNNKKFIKKEMKYIIENLPQDLNNEFIDDYIENENKKTINDCIKNSVVSSVENIKIKFNFPDYWFLEQSLSNFEWYTFDKFEIYFSIFESLASINNSLLNKTLPKYFEFDDYFSSLIKNIEKKFKDKKSYKIFVNFYNFYLSYIYCQGIFYKYVFDNLINSSIEKIISFEFSKYHAKLDSLFFIMFYNRFKVFINYYPEAFLFLLFLFLDIKKPQFFCNICLIKIFYILFEFINSYFFYDKNIDIIEIGNFTPKSIFFLENGVKFNIYLSLDTLIKFKEGEKWIVPFEFYLWFSNIFCALNSQFFEHQIYNTDYTILSLLRTILSIIFEKYENNKYFFNFFKKIYEFSIMNENNLKKMFAGICLVYVISYIDYMFSRISLNGKPNLEPNNIYITNKILDPFSLNTLAFSDIIIWEVNELREIINKIIILFNEEKITYTELEQQLIKYLKRNKKYKKILKEDRNDKEAILSIKDHNIVYYILKLIEMVLSED